MKFFKRIKEYVRLKYVLLGLAVGVCCLSIQLIDKTFWNNMVKSIKTTLESTRPTEELFDDTSGVKLVSVLFGKNSCVVSTMPLDYDLKLSDYKNFVNDNGCITVIGANGILYAPYDGVVEVSQIVDNITQITIKHTEDFSTVFSGNFGLGITDGEIIRKGQPLALMLGDMQFYLKIGNDIIDSFNENGEFLWQD